MNLPKVYLKVFKSYCVLLASEPFKLDEKTKGEKDIISIGIHNAIILPIFNRKKIPHPTGSPLSNQVSYIVVLFYDNNRTIRMIQHFC